ncbi:uncharacterized protein [Procambarus clarkii]|uniref:uncharacterized protein n=1 Tax=Procambarus clarkii TaxID=6728 RepID=UPI0037436491
MEDLEIFLLHFQKLAVSMNWPVDQWVAIMQGQFKGKAQEFFASLPAANSFDFKFVQQGILNAYQQIPEAHRQKFRGIKRAHDQIISDFARVKLNNFDRWVKALSITNFETLRNVIVAEEILGCLPEKLALFIAERKQTNDIMKLAKLADEHELLTKVPFRAQSNTYNSKSNYHVPKSHIFQARPVNPPTPMNSSPVKSKFEKQQAGLSPSNNVVSKPAVGSVDSTTGRLCTHCRRRGHVVNSCYSLHPELRPAGLIMRRGLKAINYNVVPVMPNWMTNFKPHLYTGTLLCTSGNWKPVLLLRDTDASQSVISHRVLADVSTEDTGEVVLLQGFGGHIQRVPLVKVHLKSTITPGWCTVAVSEQLPIPGVDVIVGNDFDKCQVSGTLSYHVY